jgi:hypothetical protein
MAQICTKMSQNRSKTPQNRSKRLKIASKNPIFGIKTLHFPYKTPYLRPHSEPGHDAALDQLVRVIAHDFAVLAGAWGSQNMIFRVIGVRRIFLIRGIRRFN